jgi:hypothetical protein
MMYIAVSDYVGQNSVLSLRESYRSKHTSMVSITLIMPGCRSVLSFFTAFLARGRRDLFALMSMEKILQFEPSSYESSAYTESRCEF